jgi:hypothetical protein
MRFLAALLATLLLLPLAAFAGDVPICEQQGNQECVCASREAAELLPPLPAGCHKERIAASGDQSFGVVRSAEHLGRKAWQREVITKYGERFQQWENAACPKVECVAGGIAGTRRCTYSGYACSPEVDIKALADLKRSRGEGAPPPEYYEHAREENRGRRELGSDEIAELQRLLRDRGYSVSVDGQFGEQTSEALIKWQHRAGMHEDGEATFRNLEALRHASR